MDEKLVLKNEMIENPILRGFNPDPTIIRIEEEYYIATSTFEWWPGVCIYHSHDLKSWALHSHPLNRISQLDLTGVQDGGGVWAPCLTYDGKTVYLVYTNVRERGPMMQTENYMVTTENIDGEWSEPIYLNSLGFDPSLFHDSNGKKWLLSLDNHYRENQRFNGLYLQEFDPIQKKLIGELRKLYVEPHGELVEGAHLYRFNDMYYLLKAQGGTGVIHSAQLSRSESLFGPWEDCPFILLHSRNNPNLLLQKAGHADIVETPDGELYMVHLATRYSCSEQVSIYGRETSIQKVEWADDGWLHLSQGGENPHICVPAPKKAEGQRTVEKSKFYDFKNGCISEDFQSLRKPLDDVVKFTENGLLLRGRDGLNSRYNQSLLARRIDSSDLTVTTRLCFEPEWEKHMAGLVFIYDTAHWHYLYVSRNNKTRKKEINILSCDNRSISYPLKEPAGVKENVPIELRGTVSGTLLQFEYNDGYDFQNAGEGLNINILTDEHVPLGFTGAMVGICCQDLFQKEKCAAFEWFLYMQNSPEANSFIL